MNTPAEDFKKAVLLLSGRDVFYSVEDAVHETGCRISDDVESVSGCDVVMMDSFYLKAGLAEYAKQTRPQVCTVLVLLEEEISEFRNHAVRGIDDVIIADPRNPDEIHFTVADFFRKKWGIPISKSFSPEFGTGLWVSLLSRLGAAT